LTEIFPSAYRAVEKVADSDLACWLMHPNELGATPAEMELVRPVEIQDGERGAMYLFRFRTDASHWASKYRMDGSEQNKTGLPASLQQGRSKENC
jgi:hypothetical protein